jgi:hypothetical protein
MSRWGEMFRALSHPSDTIDTADTMVAADALPAIVSHCVNSVRGVDGGKAANQRANSGQPTVADYSSDRAASPLETLRALSRSARPQCERSEKSEINAPRNEESPLHRPDEGLNSLNSLNSLISPPANAYDIEERAGLVESGAGVPGSWAEGFAALCAMPVPAGFTPERWRRIVDAAGAFLDHWAITAAGCGWSDLDVFGVDADRPDARFDAMGLVLLLDRCEIVGIDEGGADLVASPEARLRYRRRPLPAATISLWQLGQGEGA